MTETENAQFLKRFEFSAVTFFQRKVVHECILILSWYIRRVKFDSIDVHPVEKALIVFYRIEAILLSQDGEPVAGEKRVLLCKITP